MSVTYEKMTERHLPAVQELLQPFWADGWSAEFSNRFFRWRFLQRTSWDAELAFDDGHCVAMIDSFVRTYLVDGRPTAVRESCEWRTLPAYRPVVSLRVFQTLMKMPEPMLIIGGSDITQAVVPRLGWKSIAPLENNVLVLGSGALIRALSRRSESGRIQFPRALANLLSFRFRAPRRFDAPDREAAVRQLTTPDELPAALPPAQHYGLVALAELRDVDWFSDAPEAEGRFVWLVFELGGVPVGFSMSRVYRDGPITAAKFIHLQSARLEDDVFAWMIAETSGRLAELGAHWIDARFSCPLINRAFRRMGYLKFRSLPSFWWSRDGALPTGVMHLTGLRGDECLAPYPA